MSKLGIAIKPTVSGNLNPVTINEGDWTRKIHDVRPALLHFPELQDDHSKIASLFFFDEKGCFIVLARTITDNDLENISGWIYVPHDMQISTKQLDWVVDEIRRMISVSVLPEKSKLEEIFGNRELPTIKNAPIYQTSPRNGKFAKRQSRGKSLAELLSGQRFKPVYAKYESILIENTAGEVEGVDDITQVCDGEQAFLESKNKSIKYRNLIAAFLLVIGIGVLIALLCIRPSNEENKTNIYGVSTEELPIETMAVLSDTANGDSMGVNEAAAVPADTAVIGNPTASATPSETAPKSVSSTTSHTSASQYHRSDSSGETNMGNTKKKEETTKRIAANPSPSNVKAIDKITDTRYLTTMAKEYYGNYNLWSYIYLENEGKLGHPDSIKPGTTIIIPHLDKYGIDPSNPEDIDKARKLGVEIYKKNSK